MDLRIAPIVLLLFTAPLGAQVFAGQAGAERGEVAAVITEMRIGRGQVEVRTAGTPENARSCLLSRELATRGATS